MIPLYSVIWSQKLTTALKAGSLTSKLGDVIIPIVSVVLSYMIDMYERIIQ